VAFTNLATRSLRKKAIIAGSCRFFIAIGSTLTQRAPGVALQWNERERYPRVPGEGEAGQECE
ncbi:hypothetical protein ACFRKE_13110, partial [Kitasatospora indigofera]|uniref:hypothetical protein n=1 Tax=Kitasatospora indigofera TaxID=67307 RepID=UPI003681C50C